MPRMAQITTPPMVMARVLCTCRMRTRQVTRAWVYVKSKAQEERHKRTVADTCTAGLLHDSRCSPTILRLLQHGKRLARQLLRQTVSEVQGREKARGRQGPAVSGSSLASNRGSSQLILISERDFGARSKIPRVCSRSYRQWMRLKRLTRYAGCSILGRRGTKPLVKEQI